MEVDGKVGRRGKLVKYLENLEYLQSEVTLGPGRVTGAGRDPRGFGFLKRCAILA